MKLINKYIEKQNILKKRQFDEQKRKEEQITIYGDYLKTYQIPKRFMFCGLPSEVDDFDLALLGINREEYKKIFKQEIAKISTGIIGLSLILALSITSCSKDLTNYVGYHGLCESIVIEVNDSDEMSVYYIVDAYVDHDGVKYTDILTGKNIITEDETNLDVTILGYTIDYLVSMDMVKNKYNPEDINTIIDYIEETYSKEHPKVLNMKK